MCLLGCVYNLVLYVLSNFPLPYREDTNFCRKRVIQEKCLILQGGGELYVIFRLFWGSVATVTSCRDAWLKLPEFREALDCPHACRVGLVNS